MTNKKRKDNGKPRTLREAEAAVTQRATEERDARETLRVFDEERRGEGTELTEEQVQHRDKLEENVLLAEIITEAARDNLRRFLNNARPFLTANGARLRP